LVLHLTALGGTWLHNFFHRPLLFMCLFLIAAMLGVFWMFNTNGLSKIAAGFVGVIVFVAGILLTNYLGFAFVGWIPAEDK
jgi:hypothetical protein